MLFSNRCMCQRRGQGTPDPQTFSSSHISSDCCCCYELYSQPSHESSGCCCLNGSGPAESSKETSVPSSKVKLQSVVSNYQLTQKKLISLILHLSNPKKNKKNQKLTNPILLFLTLLNLIKPFTPRLPLTQNRISILPCI